MNNLIKIYKLDQWVEIIDPGFIKEWPKTILIGKITYIYSIEYVRIKLVSGVYITVNSKFIKKISKKKIIMALLKL